MRFNKILWIIFKIYKKNLQKFYVWLIYSILVKKISEIFFTFKYLNQSIN